MESGKQCGATLVVALVILLVMTMIGVATMQSSTLQERMAANARQKMIAQNAAETALREAEDWMDVNVTGSGDLSQFNGTNGLYAEIYTHAGASSARFSDVGKDITDPTDWTTFGVEVTSMDTGLVSRQPRYIIEYIGLDKRGASATKVEVLDAEAKGEIRIKGYFFRITAIGWSRDPNIYSVLESVYMTGSGDFNY